MIKAKTVTLQNENGEPVAPRTAAAVVSTESGESVQEALNRIDQGAGGGIAELPGTLTYWSEDESVEFGGISTPADTVKMASGKTLESVLAGCWIEFADKDGNPTTEPYIHWYSDPAIINFSIGETTYSAEEGMTWAEWVDSDYNADKTFGYLLEYSTVYNMDNQLISLNGSEVSPTDVISANTNYEIGVVPSPF